MIKKNLCKICNSEITAIPLCNAPIAGIKCNSIEESIKHPIFKHTFNHCSMCNMVSYHYFDEASSLLDKMYASQPSTYSLLSGASDYIKNFCKSLISKYNIQKDDNILEIGCNDGELLHEIKSQSKCNVLGIEPSSSFTTIWKDRKLNIINTFFSDETVTELANQQFKIITFRHVFEHIKEPQDFFANVAKLAQDETIIVIEVPYLKTIIDNERYENTSYSHLNYFSIRPLTVLAKQYGFHIIHQETAVTDGGSLVVHLSRQNKQNNSFDDNITAEQLTTFVSNLDTKKEKIHALIKKYSKNEIVAYGAGAKGPHLMYLFDLNNYLSYIVDDNTSFAGQYIAGTDVQVQPTSFLQNKNIKAVINFAPTHSKLIKSKVPQSLKFIDLI
ncbi:class I SAM-dependent methyltransferase [Maridesulfovibrio ferrireducens]|uniref:class I SAM-dependent methyltransferase n=1 Tax=Maridesulfovibrio ferrireducens TaxID=246191 RepID=UPI001A2ABE47|nr:class I SAM-dependent methyltransferase [Maridesulfovibrio ferrireducens]MBI9112702.1 methyltransferase domain-containing protein [Maridesulfovibrio ferrireducens]